jgi:hypothetical protein
MGLENAMYRTVLLSAALIAVTGLTLGEDFWIKKDFLQWTDEEVRKLMTNSPWAKDVTVSAPAGLVGVQRPAASPNGTDVEGGGGGRGRGRGGSAGGNEGAGPQEAIITMNMSFRSALPFRKALVKSRLGSATDLPPEAREMLNREQQDYVIVVSGIPTRIAQIARDPANLSRSTLKVGKKAPVSPRNVDAQGRTQSVELIFSFPRTDPATLEDKEIEVSLKLGELELKRKFALKDMVYNGKLEL